MEDDRFATGGGKHDGTPSGTWPRGPAVPSGSIMMNNSARAFRRRLVSHSSRAKAKAKTEIQRDDPPDDARMATFLLTAESEGGNLTRFIDV